MEKKDKKYVVIFSAYLLPHLGGIERYVDNLTRQFVKLGVSPILVTTNYDNLKEVEELNGILIIRLPIYGIFKNRYPIIKHNKKYKELMNIIDSYDVNAIIVNTRFHLTSHIGIGYAERRNIPVYLIEHGSNYVTLDNKFIDFFANRYEDFLTWKIKKKVTGFYGVSEACGEWLKHFKIQYSGVWYNSIDCEQKKPQKHGHSQVNFLYAGRLIQQKGVDNILEAFSQLLVKYDNIHLTIAGDGPLLEQFKSKYQSEKIKFVGKLDFQELLKFYAETDVFLYPPLWPEGLPTSILEAGLMSCCVIATAQGGIKEIIQDNKNGLIVDSTVKDLKLAMKRLIDDEKKRENLANQLNDTVMHKFSWSVTANKIIHDIGVFNRKEKVLHLLPSNSFSGAENVVCTIIENNLKYDMYYCCPRGEIEKVLQERKINYIPISKFNSYNVKKICLENHIDIIHAHDYKASFCAVLSGFRGKIISHIHCNYPFMKKWNMFSFAYKVVSKKFFKVAVVSEAVLEEAIFKKVIKDKVLVINNVVDIKKVQKYSLQNWSKEYDFIYFGRLEDIKNPMLFIEIINKLSKKNKNISAAIIGDGGLKDDCLQLIEKYSLKNNIDILGFQKNPFKIIKHSKVVIMPSKAEGFGLTAIESMCLEKPVINSGVGGLATIFSDNQEFICRELDEYVEVCNKLLINKKEMNKYVSACSKIIEPYTNVEKWENNIYSLYK